MVGRKIAKAQSYACPFNSSISTNRITRHIICLDLRQEPLNPFSLPYVGPQIQSS